jgi:hypothetical protein
VSVKVLVLLLALTPLGAGPAPSELLPRLSPEKVKRRAAAAAVPDPPIPPAVIVPESDTGSDGAPPSAPPESSPDRRDEEAAAPTFGGAPAPPPTTSVPGNARTATATSAPPSFETFQKRLSLHGKWIQSAEHGWIWRPRVGTDWRPYYDGQWVRTGEGWAWLSDEPWAWATYHYGRWTLDPVSGWSWVPGYEWAFAWVTWRQGDGLVGWAPLWPGWPSSTSTVDPVRLFTFVPYRRFQGLPVRSVALAPRLQATSWARTSAVEGEPNIEPVSR